MAYIGLDVGTAGCKATVVDVSGRIIAYKYKEYNLLFPKPGWVEINAQTVWESVCYVLQGIAHECKCGIKAVSVASFGEALVPLDRNDSVLDNSIFYSDIRGTEEINDILKKIDRTELENLTGMPVNSMYSLNKLLWIMKHKPGIYLNADKLMLFGDYVAYKLSGERKIDFSLSSRTMALDITNKVWAKQVFGAFSIDASKFSTPVSSGSVIGGISTSVARNLGLPENLIIISGGHDQACAALGAGVMNSGDAVDGMGTAECITIAVDKGSARATMYANNFCCEPHVCPDSYITLAFNITAGAVIKWYRDTFESSRHKDCLADGRNTYQLLDGECPGEPSHLFLLPHFAGSGTPYMDPHSSGALLGLKLASTKADIYKAILEGICFEIMFNTDMLSRSGIPVNEITAVGGGAQSDILLQLKADIMGKPVKTLVTSESGTIGLSMLCAVACGDYPDLQSAAKTMVKVHKVFYPRRDFHERYLQKYDVYKKIYTALKEIFKI